MDDTNRTTRMRRAGATALVAVALALAGPAVAGADDAIGASPASAVRALGEHPLRTLDGNRYALGSLRGHVVVVNFWASWRAPCRRELPRLDELNTELSKSGGRVIAVSIDTQASNARRFLDAHAVGMSVAHDGPDGLARLLDLKHVPCTLVLDRDGSIAYQASGSDDASLAKVVEVARRLSEHAAVATAGSETP